MGTLLGNSGAVSVAADFIFISIYSIRTLSQVETSYIFIWEMAVRGQCRRLCVYVYNVNDQQSQKRREKERKKERNSPNKSEKRRGEERREEENVRNMKCLLATFLMSFHTPTHTATMTTMATMSANI